MSFVLRTIEAFPRGRTTQQILALLDVDFDPPKRLAVQGEIENLLAEGLIRRDRGGRWRPIRKLLPRSPDVKNSADSTGALVESLVLRAAEARFEAIEQADTPTSSTQPVQTVQPRALLQYYRAALRADPRGAITQTPDRHGVSWHLVAGRGPLCPENGHVQRLEIRLDALESEFREALVRREGHENTLAIGWPLALGAHQGVPAVWPVGLIAARLERDEGLLVVEVDSDDVLVNPDWLAAAGRGTAWSRSDLSKLFAGADGSGLPQSVFADRLREAMASRTAGRLTGHNMVGELTLKPGGQAAARIFDMAALFLSTDNTFTAAAARDLDTLSGWPDATIAATALGSLLGMPRCVVEANGFEVPPAINIGPLNSEQIAALRAACTEPISVVTGPPGTGKSQVIVAMAASVIAANGSVLVASKNHQALDAVEGRLHAIAPDAPFMVRTLDPARQVDLSFNKAVQEMLSEVPAFAVRPDRSVWNQLVEAAARRDAVLDGIGERTQLHLQLSALCDEVEALRTVERALDKTAGEIAAPPSRSFWQRLASAVERWLRRGGIQVARADPLVSSERRISEIERRLIAIPETGDDPVALTDSIASLVENWLPRHLAARSVLAGEDRKLLADESDSHALSGEHAAVPRTLSDLVVAHRPLWLASVLGAPSRLPLHGGLFDLVIFDEATQCDIASSLPLLARAKRAVIVGDDRQLSFIRQIGLAQDRNLMQAHDLPLGTMARFSQSQKSLFSFAFDCASAERTMLRDQYRSASQIVDYINQFYGGRLRAAHVPGSLRSPPNFRSGLAWEDVRAPASGTAGNINRSEVAAIVRHLHVLLVQQAYDGTIGVTTPFRSQAALLQVELEAALPQEVRERSELRIATIDSFQGQERDVIIFSPTVGPASPSTGITFFNREWRRLNVAVSRGRALTHVFGDLSYARSGAIKSLAKLAAYATEQRKRSVEGKFDSSWEERVFHELKARGLDPKPQYEIAGRYLDFALFGPNGVRLDLEIDGRQWHADIDGNRKMGDLWRDHQLRSLGWRVRRFWVDELAKDMEGCLDRVQHDLS